MKKIFLLLAAFVAISAAAQTKGYDLITISISDITGNDTTLFPRVNKINDCHGNMVRFTLAIQNTDAITDTFNIGGRDDQLTSDLGAQHFETISSSALPFVVDTSVVAPATGGMTLVNDWYVKTFWLTDFPFKVPGFTVTKWALSQGDIRVYIYNVEQR